MADEFTTVDTVANTDAGTEAQNPPSDASNSVAQNTNPQPEADAKPEKPQADAPKTFTQEEVNRLITREAKKATDAALKKLADEKATAEMSDLEKERKRAEDLASENAALKRERLLDTVASDAKLPPEARAFLTGADEDELRESAKSLQRMLQSAAKGKAGALDGDKGGANGNLVGEGEMARIAAQYGLKL